MWKKRGEGREKCKDGGGNKEQGIEGRVGDEETVKDKLIINSIPTEQCTCAYEHLQESREGVSVNTY